MAVAFDFRYAPAAARSQSLFVLGLVGRADPRSDVTRLGNMHPGSSGPSAYFTAVVDDQGKVRTFADIYGLDRKVAPVVLGKAASYAPPADGSDAESNAAPAVKPKAPKENVAGSIQGLFGH